MGAVEALEQGGHQLLRVLEKLGGGRLSAASSDVAEGPQQGGEGYPSREVIPRLVCLRRTGDGGGRG